jgi:hypothetical protein
MCLLPKARSPACFCCLQVAEYLLDNGASLIHQYDEEEEEEEDGPSHVTLMRSSCLVAAAASGNPAVLEFLLHHGAPPGQHWEEAFRMAVRLQYVGVVDLLLSISPPAHEVDEEMDEEWL